MQNDVPAADRGPGLRAGLIVIAAVTLGRVLALWFNRTDLFVDEAQYWLWSQTPDFGYYSKPPMIAWVIGAVTGLFRSDAAFFVRLPAPLFHAATAAVLARIAATWIGPRAGFWAAVGWITLPVVAVGSLLVSTDTIMFPFLAAALGVWMAAASRQSAGLAALAGGLLGLAALSKYIALLYVAGAALAALSATWRPRPRVWLAALVALGLVILPNVLWNLANGFATVEHTLDNADWVRETRPLNPAGVLAFLVAQAGVLGPVMAVAFVGGVLTARGPAERLWVAFSVPIVLIMTVEALLSRAYANWAVAAYAAGTLLATGWLLRRGRGWRLATVIVNGIVSVALPAATIFPHAIRTPDGRLFLHRYLGRAELSRSILAASDVLGADTIVTDSRDVAADLFHTGRDSGKRFFVPPPVGRPRNHYEQRHAVHGPLGGTVLYVGTSGPPACAPGTSPALVLSPPEGAYAVGHFGLYLVPGNCWSDQ